MNKIFDCLGYKFNIKVELNTTTDRTPNGKTWHTITVNDMGQSSYYRKDIVLDSDLVESIKKIENDIISNVSEKLGKKELSDTEKTLIYLGFKQDL